MYSSYDLITQELGKFEDKGILDKVLQTITKQNNFTFKVPLAKKRLFRLSVLVEDLQEMGYEFSPNDLVRLLLKDFIHEIRLKNSMEQLHSILETISSRGQIGEVGYISVKLDRKLVLRSEVFLDDMENSFPLHGFTVERLLEFLLSDFMREYVKEPSLKIEEILKHYEAS